MTETNVHNSSSLPQEIVESIAISNANSIGEQPAILSNLALADRIFSHNLQQLAMIGHQQALNALSLALLSKAVMLLWQNAGSGPEALQRSSEIIKIISQIQDISAKTPSVSEPPKQA